jgi:hypothetical protein
LHVLFCEISWAVIRLHLISITDMIGAIYRVMDVILMKTRYLEGGKQIFHLYIACSSRAVSQQQKKKLIRTHDINGSFSAPTECGQILQFLQIHLETLATLFYLQQTRAMY